MKFDFSFFWKQTKKLFWFYLIQLTLFMIFRLILFFKYADFIHLKNYKSDIVKAFYVGGKFDTSVSFYALSPAFIGILVLSFLSRYKRSQYQSGIKKVLHSYLLFVTSIFLIFELIDYFFFEYFQTHINAVIFGIKEDKTTAVITSIWTDYPMIKVLVIIILAVYLFHRIYKYLIYDKIFNPINFRRYNLSALVLLLGIYFIGLRGTFSMFPLRLHHTTVSTDSFVNELVLNGVFAFKIANSFKRHIKNIDLNTQKTLQQYGFKNIKDALSKYKEKPVDSLVDTEKEMFLKTPKDKFLEKNPPNVVFILIESFSRHYFEFHQKDFNLLGDLEKELAYCTVFKNFTSARNGTIESLEGLLVNTPRTALSQSPYARIRLNSSVANPFKNANYHTTYLTGDRLGWRNTGKFIKAQNFDDVLGTSFLENKYKNPEKYEWGIFDEYLYTHIFDQLSHSKQAEFIFVLTVANHTPYSVPSTYKPKPLHMPEAVIKKLRTSKDIAMKNFLAYQYTADQLGKFIHRIRTSALGENTIIVATGDHNERGMFNYSTDELILKRSVPLILYIPKNYKPKEKIDLKRFGAHKDIFPTIYHLSLSDKSYFYSGNDLFSDDRNMDYYSLNDYDLIGSKEGAIINSKKLYYVWQDDSHLKVIDAKENENLSKIAQKAKAQAACIWYTIQEDIKKKMN